jgi:putative tryptophan/tyrosine transport system substrate-binding protein
MRMQYPTISPGGLNVIWRAFASLLAFLLMSVTAEAQQAGKVYRIGILSPDVPPPGLVEAFQDELRSLGYVEGRNVAIEPRNAGGKNERLAALADELVGLKVDVILTVNTPAAQAAKKATATIPIVITRVADPVKSGLVPSLSHPGGNLTGLSFMPDELGAKLLQLLREIVPGTSRVAALWYADNPGAMLVVREMEGASSQLGLQLLRLPVRGPSDFIGAFQAGARGRAEALVVVDDALVTKHRVPILDLAAKHSLPVVSLYKEFPEAGGLFAYGASPPAIYRRAAHYVDRILRGARPRDLPVEQPTRFELVVNLKTAKGLGLTVPPSVLLRADHVIE